MTAQQAWHVQNCSPLSQLISITENVFDVTWTEFFFGRPLENICLSCWHIFFSLKRFEDCIRWYKWPLFSLLTSDLCTFVARNTERLLSGWNSPMSWLYPVNHWGASDLNTIYKLILSSRLANALGRTFDLIILANYLSVYIGKCKVYLMFDFEIKHNETWSYYTKHHRDRIAGLKDLSSCYKRADGQCEMVI